MGRRRARHQRLLEPMMPSTLKKALPFAVIALLIWASGWFCWQSLQMDSLLDEGYFASAELAFKPADQADYERYTYGDDHVEFAEPLGFIHWYGASLDYDGQQTVELTYDGQSIQHLVEKQPQEEWRTSFGETPGVESRQLFFFEDDTLRVGTLELHPVRLEAKRGGNTAKISGQTSIDDRIYDVRWYFSHRSHRGEESPDSTDSR